LKHDNLVLCYLIAVHVFEEEEECLVLLCVYVNRRISWFALIIISAVIHRLLFDVKIKYLILYFLISILFWLNIWKKRILKEEILSIVHCIVSKNVGI
jgi:hypothetical protein